MTWPRIELDPEVIDRLQQSVERIRAKRAEALKRRIGDFIEICTPTQASTSRITITAGVAFSGIRSGRAEWLRNTKLALLDERLNRRAERVEQSIEAFREKLAQLFPESYKRPRRAPERSQLSELRYAWSKEAIARSRLAHRRSRPRRPSTARVGSPEAFSGRAVALCGRWRVRR